MHPARRPPHADTAGPVQGRALRCQGRSGRRVLPSAACRPPSCSRRSTGTTSSTSAWARRRDPTASSPHAADGRPKLPGIAVEDIGKCAYGIFKRGARVRRQDGRHRRRAPRRWRRWRRRSAKALGSQVALQTRSRRRSTAASVSRARTTWATCSSSTATSATGYLHGARPVGGAGAQSGAADVRAVAGEACGGGAAGLTPPGGARHPCAAGSAKPRHCEERAQRATRQSRCEERSLLDGPEGSALCTRIAAAASRPRNDGRVRLSPSPPHSPAPSARAHLAAGSPRRPRHPTRPARRPRCHAPPVPPAAAPPLPSGPR